MKNVLKKEGALHVYTILSTEYTIIKADKGIVEIKYYNTKTKKILRTTDLKQWFTENIQHRIEKDMEEFEGKDSGCTLRQILNLSVHINKYNPMCGSSYISLPQQIQKKHPCINLQNLDDACIKWAIALYPAHNNANVSRVQFPMSPKQIPKFERQNNISVNLYI